MPGAARTSAAIATTGDDIDRFLHALAQIASGEASPVTYDQDGHTGDYWPRTDKRGLVQRGPPPRRPLRRG